MWRAKGAGRQVVIKVCSGPVLNQSHPARPGGERSFSKQSRGRVRNRMATIGQSPHARQGRTGDSGPAMTVCNIQGLAI